MPQSSGRDVGRGERLTPAAIVLEELARRRLSRQQIAEKARISLSTLEKALSGRRPFTLATMVRLEQALGISLRVEPDRSATASMAPGAPQQAPDSLGSYARAAVSWIVPPCRASRSAPMFFPWWWVSASCCAGR